MAAYKRTVQLSELNDSILPNLKDFIEYLLDLSLLYSDTSVVMPVAEVPSASIFGASRYMYLGSRDNLKGTYQDEALLQDSAESRLNKLLLLKKLGAISSVDIDKSVPLERREVTVYLVTDEMDKLYKSIANRINTKQEEAATQTKQKNQILYRDQKVIFGDKSFDVSGWEDSVCTVVFDGSDQKTFELAVVIEENTGDMYSKINTAKYAESVRQAIYRINDKIAEEFGKKRFLRYSKKTSLITKSG